MFKSVSCTDVAKQKSLCLVHLVIDDDNIFILNDR